MNEGAIMKLELTELMWDGDALVDKGTKEKVVAYHILAGPLPIVYSKGGDKKGALVKELQDEIERRGLQDEVNAYVIGESILLPNWMVSAVELYKID